MKRIKTTIARALFAGTFGLLPGVALAQTEAANALHLGLNTAATEAGLGTTPTSLYTLVGNIINVAFGLLGIIVLVLLVYAGFEYLTSLGDAAKVDKAKKLITNTVIGLLVIVGAYAISTYLLGALTEAVG